MNKSKGMTLIEVIIAITIFSIASMMMVNGFLFAIRLYQKSANLMTVSGWANESIDHESPALFPAVISLTINGETYHIPGSYITTGDITLGDASNGTDAAARRTRFIITSP